MCIEFFKHMLIECRHPKTKKIKLYIVDISNEKKS